MLDLKFGAQFHDHGIIEVSPIVGDDVVRYAALPQSGT